MKTVYILKAEGQLLIQLDAAIEESRLRLAPPIKHFELTPDEFKSIESYLDPVYIGGEQIKADNPTYKGYNIRVVKA